MFFGSLEICFGDLLLFRVRSNLGKFRRSWVTGGIVWLMLVIVVLLTVMAVGGDDGRGDCDTGTGGASITVYHCCGTSLTCSSSSSLSSFTIVTILILMTVNVIIHRGLHHPRPNYTHHPHLPITLIILIILITCIIVMVAITIMANHRYDHHRHP